MPGKPLESAAEPASTRRRKKRRLPRTLLLAAGLYVGLCGGLAWQTVRAKPERMSLTPAGRGMAFEAVSFTSRDGTRLSGWLIPAASVRPRGVIVFCHGVDSTRLAMLRKAEILHAHGFAALLFDFRARGESGGGLCTIG